MSVHCAVVVLLPTVVSRTGGCRGACMVFALSDGKGCGREASRLFGDGARCGGLGVGCRAAAQPADLAQP